MFKILCIISMLFVWQTLFAQYDDAEYFVKAKEEFMTDDTLNAIHDFSKAIEINPKYAEAYFYRGWEKNNMGDYKGAVDDVSKAIEFEHDSVYRYYLEIAQNNLKDYPVFSQLSAEKLKVFNPAYYPADMFDIRYDSAQFLNYTVELIHVKNMHYEGLETFAEEETDKNYFDCRGWLLLKKGSKILHSVYYSSINAVGGCSGIYFPAKQPRNDYFVAVKYGDYEGRVIIIDSIGNMIEKLGGSLQVSNDGRYLFSNYSSDAFGVTIFDFKDNYILISGTYFIDSTGKPQQRQCGAWYYQDGKYAAQIYNNNESDNGADSLITIGMVDFQHETLIFSKQDNGYFNEVNLLDDLLPDFNSPPYCDCGPKKN